MSKGSISKKKKSDAWKRHKENEKEEGIVNTDSYLVVAVTVAAGTNSKEQSSSEAYKSFK
jgi:hypothetical protein